MPEHKQLKRFLVVLVLVLLGVITFAAVSVYRENTPVVFEEGKKEKLKNTVPTPPTTEEARKGLEVISGGNSGVSSETPPTPPSENQMKQQLEKVSKSPSDSQNSASPAPPTEDEAKKQFEIFENN